MKLVIWSVVFLIFLEGLVAIPQLFEDERVYEYHRRGYTWPPLKSEFVPQSQGWMDLLQRLLEQVDLLTVDDRSYDAYLTTLSSVLLHNYTKYGWAITKAPPSAILLMEDYIQSSVSSLNGNTIEQLPLEEPDEIAIDTIENDESTTNNRPKMMRIPNDLKTAILEELLPIMEAWAGNIALEPVNAYGLRIYQNTSKLYMHLDQRKTHVISAIFHIGHDTNRPWPLVIEDFLGNTNEVYLQPGELLLYESSKCWHGRPHRMEGVWYTSLFVHYRPKYAPPTVTSSSPPVPFSEYIDDMEWKVHHRVPPHWNVRHERQTTSEISKKLEAIVMPDTFAMEPECPDGWCSLKNSIIVEGPAPQQYGIVLTANGELYDLGLTIWDEKEL